MLAPSKCGLCPRPYRVNNIVAEVPRIAGKEFLRQGGFATRGAIVIRHRRCAVKRENGVGGRCFLPYYK